MSGRDLLVLAAYLVAAASLLRAAAISRAGARLGRRWTGPERRARDRAREDRRRTLAWAALAGLVTVGGALRVSGGLEALTHAARTAIRDVGWYAGRGPWQMAITIAAVAACGLLALLVLGSRRAHRRQRLGVAAAALLAATLAVRTISWHGAEVLVVREIGGIRLIAWGEAAALVGLALAGVLGARAAGAIRRAGAAPRAGAGAAVPPPAHDDRPGARG